MSRKFWWALPRVLVAILRLISPPWRLPNLRGKSRGSGSPEAQRPHRRTGEIVRDIRAIGQEENLFPTSDNASYVVLEVDKTPYFSHFRCAAVAPLYLSRRKPLSAKTTLQKPR